jgi:hypothetical protein
MTSALALTPATVPDTGSARVAEGGGLVKAGLRPPPPAATALTSPPPSAVLPP